MGYAKGVPKYRSHYEDWLKYVLPLMAEAQRFTLVSKVSS